MKRGANGRRDEWTVTRRRADAGRRDAGTLRGDAKGRHGDKDLSDRPLARSPLRPSHPSLVTGAFNL